MSLSWWMLAVASMVCYRSLWLHTVFVDGNAWCIMIFSALLSIEQRVASQHAIVCMHDMTSFMLSLIRGLPFAFILWTTSEPLPYFPGSKVYEFKMPCMTFIRTHCLHVFSHMATDVSYHMATLSVLAVSHTIHLQPLDRIYWWDHQLVIWHLAALQNA